MEIAAREMDSRLLIAFFAATRGMDVVLGPKWMLQKNASLMPRGLWIFKTLTPSDSRRMASVARKGHAVAAIDEEMPGIGDAGSRLRWVSKASVEAANAIFCLGEEHADLMRRFYPEHAGKLIITGNPRWDFLRPELRSLYGEDAKRLNDRHGRFILINTNIGLMNSAKSSPEGLIANLTKDGKIDLDLPEDQAFVDDLKAFESANFAAVPPLVRRLAKTFPNRRIVVRPHPTEKLDAYQQAFADLGQVDVVCEGPAAPWLAASDLLVHTSCTTASEAYALDKRSVCFQTIPSPLHDYFLSGAFSEIATTEDDVIAQATRILTGDADDGTASERRARFGRHFAAQDGAFAAERIAEYAADATVPIAGGGGRWKPGLVFVRHWPVKGFRRRIFPKFTAADVEARMARLVNALGRRETPTVKRIGHNQFHIYADGA